DRERPAAPARNDLSDDLVSGHDRKGHVRQLAVDDVKIGSADAAGADFEQYLSRAGRAQRASFPHQRFADAPKPHAVGRRSAHSKRSKRGPDRKSTRLNSSL